MTRILLTTDGEMQLQNELQQLKRVDRPNIILAIAEARAHGDLSENAEYHPAREQQGFIEGGIAELEDKLSRAEVIDSSQLNAGGKIVFRARVTLWEEAGAREVSYQIVGELEADIDRGLISHSSPLARALLGRTKNDEIEVDAPGGIQHYRVLSVTYGS